MQEIFLSSNPKFLSRFPLVGLANAGAEILQERFQEAYRTEEVGQMIAIGP